MAAKPCCLAGPLPRVAWWRVGAGSRRWWDGDFTWPAEPGLPNTANTRCESIAPATIVMSLMQKWMNSFNSLSGRIGDSPHKNASAPNKWLE